MHVIADVTATRRAARTLATSCDAVLPACEDATTLAWLAARVPGGACRSCSTSTPTASRRRSSRRAGSSPRSTCRGRPRGPLGAFPRWSSRAPRAGARASSSPTMRRSSTLPEASWRRPAMMWSSRSTCPGRRCRSRCWRGVGVPCRSRSPAWSSTRRTTASAWSRRWARRRKDRLRRSASTARVTGTRPSAPACWRRWTPPALRIALGLRLNGLMDVEVMVGGPEPKVLEVDARLPSQTPTAVYWSSGLNIVELLAETARVGAPPAVDRTGPARSRLPARAGLRGFAGGARRACHGKRRSPETGSRVLRR